MPKLTTAKIQCSFSVVPTMPLSPFVWGILKTVTTFPLNNRPHFETLATKLGVGEKSFFSQAWIEALEIDLVDSDDYQTTSLSTNGETALIDGFIRNGETSEHIEDLYFKLHDGQIIEWNHKMKEANPSKLKPVKWVKRLSAQCIAEAISKQIEDKERHIDPDETMFNLEFDWNNSQKVDLVF